jgi:predicted CopG family antitoxin
MAQRMIPFMISIPITKEAYEALKATTPGIDQAPTSLGSDGQVEIWLDRAVVDRLQALREPGEGYSDVIIRLAAEENGSAE